MATALRALGVLLVILGMIVAVVATVLVARDEQFAEIAG